MEETCNALRTSRTTVMRLIEARELRATKPGPHITSPVMVVADSVATYISRNSDTPILGDVLPKLWTLDEVSKETGFALRTLQRDCRADKIPHVHRGRDRLMTTEQVWALIAQHTVKPVEDPAITAEKARKAKLQARLERMVARAATKAARQAQPAARR